MTNKNLSNISALSLMLFLLGQTFAGQTAVAQSGINAEIIGSWEWSMSIGPMKKSSVSLEVTEVKGKLVAVATGPDGTKIESDDFKYEDGVVQFSIRRQIGIVAMTMSHQGKLEKGRISGKVKVSGPINQTMDWDAKQVEKKRR